MHGNDTDLGQRGVAVIRAALIMLALAACGSPPAILPPNTVQVCERAIECGVFHRDDRAQCVLCLEHVNPAVIPHPEDLPPLGDAPCSDAERLTETNLPACIAEKWSWE